MWSDNRAGSSETLPETSVVFLVNFLAPNHVAVCHELAQRVKSLTILSSVAMEGNRDWQPEWDGLDVRVQKTWTMTRRVGHPGGYEDVNYIHVPRDTLAQLRHLRPDAIVSLELGARTTLAGIHQKRFPSCAMVTSVYASQRSEAGRGWIRRATRRRLLKKADWVTFNGPSCREYLLGLGARPSRMSPWDYAADPTKPYRGPLRQDSETSDEVNILTVGQLSERKGILPAAEQLGRWALQNPSLRVQWHLLGSGPLETALREFPRTDHLNIHLHGHCDPQQIRQAYRDSDVLLFPTLTDEWGLVVDESLHSGLPVIGSVHSQAATTLIQSGQNGFLYDPEQTSDGQHDSLSASLDAWYWSDSESMGAKKPRHARSAESRLAMRESARSSAADRTPERSAIQLVNAISSAMQVRGGNHESIGDQDVVGASR
ncbi:MAG: glycosyltransferase family 4 protein [Planctomycetota bacterium]